MKKNWQALFPDCILQVLCSSFYQHTWRTIEHTKPSSTCAGQLWSTMLAYWPAFWLCVNQNGLKSGRPVHKWLKSGCNTYTPCTCIWRYIPTTFSGSERFRSTVVPLLSSILHVYTPSSSESTLHRSWVKGVLEHVLREATTTPLCSHFREETGVELERECWNPHT